MSNVRVSSQAEFSGAVHEIMEDVKIATKQSLEKAVDKTAREIVSKTKNLSPARSGVYAKNWRSKKTEGRVGTYGRVVYQSKKPSLTHLLENGHEIKGAEFYRKNKSRTDPIHHITPDEEAEKILTKNLEKEVDKEMSKV